MEENKIENENIQNEEKEEEKKENLIEENNNPSLTIEQQNELYEKIKSYLGGPNLDENGEIKDISFLEWVEKNEGIKHLCEPYEVIFSTDDKDANEINNIILNNYKNNKDVNCLRNPFGILENHDYACELKLLKWITEDEKHQNNFVAIENKNEEIKLNQYNDILPYKYNIVPLDKNNKEININNYINASFITNPLNNKENIIIATQTPMKDTINSFWKMVYNYKIKLIIMLSDISKEEEKSSNLYFPIEKGNILDIIISDDLKLKIELIHKEDVAPNIAVLKRFKINDEFELNHIQILSWPNKGLPGENFIVNMIIEKLIKYFEEQLNDKIPVIVHCNDGVGRTGTLITIFILIICLEELKKIQKKPIMGIFNVVRKLREQRYSSVTDVEQYKFIYDFVLYWIKKNYPIK